MEMTYRFRIKPGQSGAFVEWTKQQEASPPKAPDGWTYKGTYFVVQGFGDFDAEARWELDDYGALGNAGGSDEWEQANREFFETFYDDRFPGTQALMKSADDVYVPEGW